VYRKGSNFDVVKSSDPKSKQQRFIEDLKTAKTSMAKRTTKAPKATYLEPPKELKTVQLNYDPQTKVRDAFEDDLEFLLHNVAKAGQPMIDSPPNEPKRNQKKKKDKEVIKEERKQSVNLTKESRREILDFDIDFSSDDEQGQLVQPKTDNKNHSKIMNRFMENQLGIGISQNQNDELDSTDIESIDDYLQMLDSSDDNFSEDGLYDVSDEEQQIKLGEELNIRKLSQSFEKIQLQRGAKGQKKTYTSFIDHAPGTNWNRLKQRLVIGKKSEVSEQTGECQVKARTSPRIPRNRAAKKASHEKNERPKKTADKESISKRDKKLNLKHEITKDGSSERLQKNEKPMQPSQKPQKTKKNRKPQPTEKKASSLRDQKASSDKKSSSQPSSEKTTKEKKNFKHPTKLIPEVSTA
jgi:hypothetical protein